MHHAILAVRFFAVTLLVGSTIAGAGPACAQSPSPTPGLSPRPSASPFPYPTTPPASDVPHGPKLVPRGKPDASVTRHGIRLELWQSSPAVAPGEWVRFAVRTTNLGRDSAWQMSGECLTSGTVMTADLRAVTPPGETWTGNAAAYKERVTKRSTTEWIPDWRSLGALWATATAWAECTVMAGPLELRPGQSRVEHFAWYAGDRLSPERDDIWTPPYPGTASVRVEWPFLARGARPRVPDLRRVRTGPDPPGAAAHDHRRRARSPHPSTSWSTSPCPTRRGAPGWRRTRPARAGTATTWTRLLGGDRTTRVGFLDTYDHPNGILELELQQRLPGEVNEIPGSILLDPWTGEVLYVRVPDRVVDAAASAGPSPIATSAGGPVRP